MTCINCGQHAIERYCGGCGQYQYRSRFALGALMLQAVEDAFNLDRGLLHTAVALTHRPGRMVREYLQGRTRPYSNPVKYLVIWVALATFVTLAMGHVDALLEAVFETPREASEAAGPLLDWAQRYFNVLAVAAVPLLPVFSRLFFRKAPYTFTEHLIFNVFIYAHLSLAFGVTLPLFALLSDDVLLYGNLYMTLVFGYYVFACRQFFEVSLASSAWRGSLVLVLTYLVSSLAVAAAAISWLTASAGSLPNPPG